MNPRNSFLLLGLLVLFALLPNLLSASVGPPTPKRDLSGKIVEINRRAAIVVIEDFKGWDRVQTQHAAVGERSNIKRWLEGLGPKQAAIYLKPEDMKPLKEGMTLHLKGYSYAFASSGNGHGPTSISRSYDELRIEEGKR